MFRNTKEAIATVVRLLRELCNYFAITVITKARHILICKKQMYCLQNTINILFRCFTSFGHAALLFFAAFPDKMGNNLKEAEDFSPFLLLPAV